MASKRNYGTGVNAALASLCRGSCYWPDCGEPVVRFVQGIPVANLQIAHIHALEENGPRYKNDMTEEEKNSFSNLILLCHPHHVIVDRKAPDRFSPEVLFRWKDNREADGQKSLAGLKNITEEKLESIINVVISEQNKRIEDAVSRLENIDSEAAQSIRELQSEVEQLRRSSSFIDPDAINTLYAASRSLRGQLDPDTAGTLLEASKTLRGSNIEALISALQAFEESFRRMQSYM